MGGGDGSGGNASDGERWGAADEASLARLPLTSCCAARFLTGRRTGTSPWPGGWRPLLYTLHGIRAHFLQHRLFLLGSFVQIHGSLTALLL